MGFTRITNDDNGSRAIVNGISLEGHAVRERGTIQGVSQDNFGDIVEVKLDSGSTQHFRQNEVSGTGM